MSSPQIERFGHYRLLSAIYTGQTSRVWKAYDDSERRNVAIKTLLPAAAKKRAQVTMLRRDYQIASILAGKNVPQMIELGRQYGIPFLVMEWFPGPSVKQMVRLGYANYCPILTELIPRLFEPLLLLHAAGYVHRDLKPDNYLYTPELGVRLIDFAIARKMGRGGFLQFFAPKGITQGTATYMAPEQIRNGTLDGRTDLYALGGTIFELVTGIPPFTGNSMSDLLHKHLSGPVPVATAKNRNITPEFSAFLQSMMAKSPKDRPATARAAFDTICHLNIFLRPPKSGDKLT